ncbi:MAG TPA: glycosyltransferase family A protein [Thermoleophilaceae bacterium]|nr:glycosyltransferase family A protein [Thermoleophilaceae bacterium]
MTLRQRLVDAGHELRVMGAVLVDAYVRPRPRAHDGPLVTVVIAAYNRSEVLRYALASAVGQTYRNLEILVIGDACTDDSERVVAAADDPRVRWINLERNSGSQAGPNQAGLEMARGELIAYLGQDDVWRSDHVALLVADIERTGADVTSAIPSYVWPKPVPVRKLESPRAGAFVPTPATMHRRRAGIAGGGWRNHRDSVLAPDEDFFQRMRDAGARYSRVRALSLLKFASALRPGSYRDGRSDEQAAASRRIESRAFAAREVLAALASMPLRGRYGQHVHVPDDLRARPGGVIAEYRRIRGLQP